MKPETVQQKSVADYERGDQLKHIAVRYNVSVGTVSLWAKKAGLTRRKRGCRHKMTPSEADMRIVAAVKAVVEGKPTLDELGDRFGYTRAGIHRIYCKWKNWKPTIPFKPGDLIRFAGTDFEVVKANVFDGTVRSVKTGKTTRINWWRNKEFFAVKL